MSRNLVCTRGPGQRKHHHSCNGRGARAILLHPSLEQFGSCAGSDHFSLGRVDGALACSGSVCSTKVFHLPLAPVEEAKGTQWLMHRPCICNTLNALAGRVGKCVPPPSEHALKTLLAPVVDVMAAHVGRHAPVPYETVYSRMPAKKRARYKRAHQVLTELGGFCQKRHARISMFVKLEGLKFDWQKVNPDCRAIQFRSPEFTLQLASAIKVAEHALYDLADLPGFGPGRLFAKNLNSRNKAAELRRKYESIPGCHILCLDASRFDAHCSALVLRIVEHRFWMGTCMAPQLAQLLQWQIDNVGMWIGRNQSVRYKSTGGRMSGDANTAAGNCIIMGTMLKAFGDWSERKFTFLCDGDDSVFFHDGEPITDEEIDVFFLQFGFVMQVEDRPTCIEQTTFCQARLCVLDGMDVMIRDPMKILSKTTVSHKLREPAIRGKFIKTVALGELSISRGCPVVQPFLVKLIENCDRFITKAQRKKGLVYDWVLDDMYRLRSLLPSDWKSGRVVEITTEARVSFANAWGIPVERQVAIERALELWTFDLGEALDGYEWDVQKWLSPIFQQEAW